MTTKTIKCACGRTVHCRPNANGVVLCPNCRSAYTPEQFRRDDTRVIVTHDVRTGEITTTRERYPDDE